MRAVDIIMDKRLGKELSREAISFLINGYVVGNIPDYQVAAWAMAVCLNGMTPAETAALTETMLASGTRINLNGIEGPFVDKHSTGGVGDKTSLILAPLAAAIGVRDPMMAGRALGHTGGTLDKLDAIPGYRTQLTVAEFRTTLASTGFAITGQTKDIVPADRLLYALRDVTATVESVPLITASILSKKAAEGADALVLDVKYGSGAFMKDPLEGETLARSLVDTGAAMGKRIIVLLTDMNEPLGNMVGNFLEVEECLDCLEDFSKTPPDLAEVTLELAARMAVLGGKVANADDGRVLCAETLASGKPLSLFLKNVADQGGNVKQLCAMRGAYRSPFVASVRAAQDAYIARIDAWKTGHAAVILGVGRNRASDTVSPLAGVQLHKKGRDMVHKGDLLMTVWGKDEAALATAIPQLEAAIEYAPTPPAKRTLVLKELVHA
ncbi:MAG: thymidine phosphorylase [Treponema sp.]|jgi:pyrimidine-nucleoside phosphorylase|nr:thymidine phosphorylase [Treponema sp.]